MAASSLRAAMWTKSVSAAPPGMSELTVTPVPSRSLAQINVAASIATLLTPYGELLRRCMVARLVVMLMMRPHPAATMCGTALRAIRKVPLTLVTMISRQTSGSASQNFSDRVCGERSKR